MLAKDAVIAGALIVSAAVLLTAHLWLAIGLTSRHQPRWHVWFLLLPISVWLAPYWGRRAGLRFASGAWVVSALVYFTAELVSRR